MTKKFTACLVALAVVALLLAFNLSAGCIEAPDNNYSKNSENIVAYGNGVYHFTNLDTFGNDLSQFIREHPDLKLVGFSYHYQGMPSAYWVAFEKRPTEACACNCTAGR